MTEDCFQVAAQRGHGQPPLLEVVNEETLSFNVVLTELGDVLTALKKLGLRTGRYTPYRGGCSRLELRPRKLGPREVNHRIDIADRHEAGVVARIAPRNPERLLLPGVAKEDIGLNRRNQARKIKVAIAERRVTRDASHKLG